MTVTISSAPIYRWCYRTERLPKMRALVPARELKKLDKQFGLDGTGKPPPKMNAQLGLL